MQVEDGAEIECAANEPAKEDAKNSAEETDDACFYEKKLLDVAVSRAKGFQNADFTTTLEDGHDERVDDAERGDGQSETAEDCQEKIEDEEKDAQALGSVEKRERAKPEILELGFRGFHQ